MKKILLACLVCLVTGATAQSYISAGGLRLGTGVGFTFQQKVARRTTIEAIINSSFRKDRIQLSLLGEQHFPLLSRRFNFYLGAGPHKSWNLDGEATSSDPFGVSFVMGGEMTIRRLILSYDFKPSINFQGEKVLDLHTALSLRYVFYRKTLRERMKANRERRKRRRARKRKKRQRERDKRKDGSGFPWPFRKD